jgi:hypothetical protein
MQIGRNSLEKAEHMHILESSNSSPKQVPRNVYMHQKSITKMFISALLIIYSQLYTIEKSPNYRKYEHSGKITQCCTI